MDTPQPQRKASRSPRIQYATGGLCAPAGVGTAGAGRNSLILSRCCTSNLRPPFISHFEEKCSLNEFELDNAFDYQQFHSEFKTDLHLELLPSGKFSTNTSDMLKYELLSHCVSGRVETALIYSRWQHKQHKRG